MSTRRIPTVCPPCGKPGTLHGPAVALKFAPKRPTPLNTGVALNEVAWKDAAGEEVDCTICAYPMSADSVANPWTGPGLFMTQACVNGHVYHKGCLLTWLGGSANCPECRNPILSEVAASLRRNGAPASVPPPPNSGGGGLFGGGGGGLFGGGGGGANQDDFWSGGQEEADAAAARLRERERRTLNNDNAASPWERIYGGGGGGANQDDFWSGGQEEADAAAARLREREREQERRTLNNDNAASLWERIYGGGSGGGGGGGDDGAERRRLENEERRRLENEERRVAQLPYRSLATLPEMTGINGHFFFVGGLDDNPRPLEIVEALRSMRTSAPVLYADKLHIQMREQNLNPFHGGSESGGMKVTLVQYEFNGLTNQEGETFVGYYLDMVGVPGGLGQFYREFFDLPTTPKASVNGAPKWGEDPLGRPPSLNIAPDEYDEWVGVAQEERAVRARSLS